MMLCVRLDRWRPRSALAVVAALGVAFAPFSHASAQTITLEVDATQLPRNLLRSRQTIQAAPGPLDLYFCMWTPGNHTPSGPIENLVDLVIRDCNGNTLRWDRDPAQVERFTLSVPEGCTRIEVALGYIASQPNPNSRSTDTYGRSTHGALNWNTALLYPGGAGHQAISVQASLVLPAGWSFATALPVDEGAAGPLTFQTVPLAQLIDSPVIMGVNLRTFELDVKLPGAVPHRFHTVGPDARSVVVPDWLLEKYADMCRQTMLLFAKPGAAPFPRERYDFLVMLDETARAGVEHGTSTFIALPTRTFMDAKKDDVQGGGRDTTVVPHEYFHAWCGKHVAPQGLVRPDFHTPVHPELLWVYEGLTSYYDNVLAARGGLLTSAEYLHEVLTSAVTFEQRSGRLWRSVEDTARSARLLRQRGMYWYDHRRGQDYYGEGALFWMEADAIIRSASQGQRSLDDFAREFFDRPVRPVGDQATYTRADVVAALSRLHPGTDWDALVRARIEEPVSTLDLAPLLARLGWRVEFAPEATPEQKKFKAFDEAAADEPNLRTSLGIRVNKQAEVVDIVPGSPADEAGLGYGMKLIAVNDTLYTAERLRDAVRQSPESGSVTLLVSMAERVQSVTITYKGGPRVPRLVRIESAPDLLLPALAPLDRPGN